MNFIPSSFKMELFDFCSLSRDYVFKSLWMNGSDDTKNFFYRVIGRIVGYNVRDFSFYSNELPSRKRNSINHRVDFLLIAPDGKRKVNIELNRSYYKTLMRRNEAYLYRIAGNFYDQRRKDVYNNGLLVDQVNLNCFKSCDDKGIKVSCFTMKDNDNNLDLHSIRIINIYIPTISMSCYNCDIEELLDYKMFMANSFDEMASYVKGNKERMSVMKDMYYMMNDEVGYSYPGEGDALWESIENEIRENGRNEGRKEGIKEGIKEGEQGFISKLLASGMSKEELAKRLNVPISKLNS